MENLSSLPSADIISIIGIITSTIASIIAIIISVLTLKQNSKMIEGSTRPYIVAYTSRVCIEKSVCNYLIVKNFGQSAAKIDSFTCKPNLTKYGDSEYDNPFYKFNGTTIVPGQAFRCIINVPELRKDVEDLMIDLTYSDAKHTYNEKFQVHLSANEGNAIMHRQNNSNNLLIIPEILQEMLINSL